MPLARKAASLALRCSISELVSSVTRRALYRGGQGMSAHLLEGFAAVPFDGIGHGGGEGIKLVTPAPAGVVVLVIREGQDTLARASPIKHADMVVRIGDAMNVKGAGPHQ